MSTGALIGLIVGIALVVLVVLVIVAKKNATSKAFGSGGGMPSWIFRSQVVQRNERASRPC